MNFDKRLMNFNRVRPLSNDIKMRENELELARRKQKISENPTFKDDIEFISEQLELFKKQRDIYKAILEQYENSLDIKTDVTRCQSLAHNSFQNKNHRENDHDNQRVEPLSPSYGHDLGDRIDKLNLQIKNLKQAFEEKSPPHSPLKKSCRESQIPYSLLRNRNIESSKKFRSKSVESLHSIQKKMKNISKNLTKSFNFELSEEIMENAYNCTFQEKLEYFPMRIKELELENKELEKILDKLQTKDMFQSTLSLDRTKHRKINFNFDNKRYELEQFQLQLDARSKALDLREQELRIKEKLIARKIGAKREKEKKRSVVNKINISNISNQVKCPNVGIHYDVQNQLKEAKNTAIKKYKIDESTEKISGCKTCSIF